MPTLEHNEGAATTNDKVAINKVHPAKSESGEILYIVTEKFQNKIEYALSCIGYAVGYGNVWRFPFLCYSLGGFGFLIPYFFSFFLIAVPFFLLETGYGQMIDMPLHHRWGAIVPRLWGFKFVQTWICFWTVVYYITLMAWSFYFFFASWKWSQDTLPWYIPEPDQNTGTTSKVYWSDDYYKNKVMQLSPSALIQG